VEVTNTGSRDGEEVVQLYIRKPDSKMVRPLKDLRGFERVSIAFGKSRLVTIDLGPEELSIYDTEKGMYTVEKGVYEIMVGPSSADSGLIRAELLVSGVQRICLERPISAT
jgi:beta-glucosidase